MKKQDYAGISPHQYTGTEIGADASIELNDETDARSFYETAKDRLLNVNNWHKVAGLVSASFQLVDATGQEVDRKVEKGDFLKIDIPGPGSSQGVGYDWVTVEERKEIAEGDNQSIGFRVRPAQNPHGSKKETAHFYSSEATSNFIVMREKTKITSWIIDRNIKPNNHADGVMDKVRDVAIGIGAIGMFSKVQWQGLADGLIKKDED